MNDANHQPLLRRSDSHVLRRQAWTHFHANYAEYRALISIADGTILAGDLPTRAYNLVLEWLALHRAELEANWEHARRHEPLDEIPPLN